MERKQNLPEELLKEIEEMLVVKAGGGEKDKRPQLPVIQKFIIEEIDRYGQISKDMADDRNPQWGVLDGIFLKFGLKIS
ncbi:MAG: nucleotidyltransferase domain-containing protein [Lachnospiraceae bacterium]|nr:nucleotidyltransferase domain-containing protein [Lachnospiraceae bacterium]